MQLRTERLRRAPSETGPSAAPATGAGVTIVVGSAGAILGVFVPWLEMAFFGMSLSRASMEAATLSLVIVAVISIVTASFTVLRRPATSSIAGIFILLGAAQLGLAIWSAVSIVRTVAVDDPHQVFINAIGTGAYACVLGALLALAGGVLAWSRREPAAAQT